MTCQTRMLDFLALMQSSMDVCCRLRYIRDGVFLTFLSGLLLPQGRRGVPRPPGAPADTAAGLCRDAVFPAGVGQTVDCADTTAFLKDINVILS